MAASPVCVFVCVRVLRDDLHVSILLFCPLRGSDSFVELRVVKLFFPFADRLLPLYFLLLLETNAHSPWLHFVGGVGSFQTKRSRVLRVGGGNRFVCGAKQGELDEEYGGETCDKETKRGRTNNTVKRS